MVNLYLLSKMDVTAMRQCNTVSFHRLSSGDAVVRCNKRIERKSPFDDDERQHEIPAASSMRLYGPDHGEPSQYRGFSMLHSCLVDECWHSVCAFIKPGDALNLHFIGDSNTYCTKSGLHIDKFQLEILRPLKNGAFNRYGFVLDVSVCPDNSARMVQPIEYRIAM
jgi:hypothetical protein